MKQYKSFAWDVGLIGIANLVNNFKSLIVIPLLTKFLGAYNYGVWSQIKITLALLVPFLVFASGQAIAKFLAGTDDNNKIREDLFSCLFTSLIASFIMAVFCFIFCSGVSMLLLGNREYKILVKLFAVLLLLESGNSILLEYLKAFRYIKAYFRTILLETAMEFGLLTYAIFNGYGILGAVGCLLITRCLFILTRVFYVTRKIGFSFPRFTNIGRYLAFGAPLVFSGLFLFVQNWGNRYIINYFLGLKEVGIYSAAFLLSYTITFIGAPIGYILFPTLASCINRSEVKEAATYLKYSLKYFLMAGIALIFALSFVSKELLILFSTSEFLIARPYMPLLLVGIFIAQIGAIGEYVNIVFGKNVLMLQVYTVIAVVNTILNIILIPLIGLLGAALATLLSFILYSAFNLWYCQRFVRFGMDMRITGKIFFSAFFMVFSLYLFKKFVPGINILFFLPVSTFIYLVLLYAFRCFTTSELTLFKSMASRNNA